MYQVSPENKEVFDVFVSHMSLAGNGVATFLFPTFMAGYLAAKGLSADEVSDRVRDAVILGSSSKGLTY